MPLDQRDRQNIAVALVIAVLVVAGFWLMTTMRHNAKLEECLLARRRDCDTIR